MFSRLIPIIRKEFIHLFRDPRALTLMIFMPILLLFLYGYAASFDIKNIPIAVFDQDNTSTSRGFLQKFTNNNYFYIVENLRSDSQFQDRMSSDNIKAIFNIPPNFAKNIASGAKTEIQILVDGSDPTWAQSALGYVNGISQQYYQKLIATNFQKMGIKTAASPPINLETRIWYNETLRSLNFYVPGLICLILMQLSATLTSGTIVTEKEQGTMEGLVVSPIRKNELMFGKLIPYVIISFIDVMLVTGIGIFWFGVPFMGNFLLLVVTSIIFLVGAMSIGLLISTNAKSSQEAMQLATLATMLPSLLLSGFVFPIENMPFIVQLFSYLIPARYFLVILRGIFLKGIGLEYFMPEFIAMLLLSTFFVYASVKRFKKRID